MALSGARKTSRAPIHNPYDKFTQDQFDNWIDGITGALRQALGQETEPQEEVTHLLVAEEPSDHEEEQDVYEEDIEDSFAEVKARRAKGKARDPREGPGLGGDRSQPIEIDSGDESESSQEQEEEEVYDDHQQRETSVVEITELDSDEEAESMLIPREDESSDEDEVQGYHDSDEYNKDDNQGSSPGPTGRYLSGMARLGYAVPTPQPASGPREEVYEFSDDDEFPPSETPLQLPDIADPWEGPRTYAEDFYDEGDFHEIDEQEGEEGLVLTPGLHTPSDDHIHSPRVFVQDVADPIDVDEEDESNHPTEVLPLQQTQTPTDAADLTAEADISSVAHTDPNTSLPTLSSLPPEETESPAPEEHDPFVSPDDYRHSPREPIPAPSTRREKGKQREDASVSDHSEADPFNLPKGEDARLPFPIPPLRDDMTAAELIAWPWPVGKSPIDQVIREAPPERRAGGEEQDEAPNTRASPPLAGRSEAQEHERDREIRRQRRLRLERGIGQEHGHRREHRHRHEHMAGMEGLTEDEADELRMLRRQVELHRSVMSMNPMDELRRLSLGGMGGGPGSSMGLIPGMPSAGPSNTLHGMVDPMLGMSLGGMGLGSMGLGGMGMGLGGMEEIERMNEHLRGLAHEAGIELPRFDEDSLRAGKWVSNRSRRRTSQEPVSGRPAGGEVQPRAEGEPDVLGDHTPINQEAQDPVGDVTMADEPPEQRSEYLLETLVDVASKDIAVETPERGEPVPHYRSVEEVFVHDMNYTVTEVESSNDNIGPSAENTDVDAMSLTGETAGEMLSYSVEEIDIDEPVELSNDVSIDVDDQTVRQEETTDNNLLADDPSPEEHYNLSIPMPVSADPSVPDPTSLAGTPPHSPVTRPQHVPGTPTPLLLSQPSTPGIPIPVSVSVPVSVLKALKSHNMSSSQDGSGLFTPLNDSEPTSGPSSEAGDAEVNWKSKMNAADEFDVDAVLTSLEAQPMVPTEEAVGDDPHGDNNFENFIRAGGPVPVFMQGDLASSTETQPATVEPSQHPADEIATVASPSDSLSMNEDYNMDDSTRVPSPEDLHLMDVTLDNNAPVMRDIDIQDGQENAASSDHTASLAENLVPQPVDETTKQPALDLILEAEAQIVEPELTDPLYIDDDVPGLGKARAEVLQPLQITETPVDSAKADEREDANRLPETTDEDLRMSSPLAVTPGAMEEAITDELPPNENQESRTDDAVSVPLELPSSQTNPLSLSPSENDNDLDGLDLSYPESEHSDRDAPTFAQELSAPSGIDFDQDKGDIDAEGEPDPDHLGHGYEVHASGSEKSATLDPFVYMGNIIAPGATEDDDDFSISSSSNEKETEKGATVTIDNVPFRSDSALEEHTEPRTEDSQANHSSTTEGPSEADGLKRSPKRKRKTPTPVPSRLTRSMSTRIGKPTEKKGDPSIAGDDREDENSEVGSSSSASAASKLLLARSRTVSRASSVVSNATSSGSSLILQPSPTKNTNGSLSTMDHIHSMIHHHHGRRRPSPPMATQRRQLRNESSSSRVSAPETSSSQAHQGIYFSSPVTRSNCRFHKISIPKDEDGPRVYFLMPGCSLNDRELIEEEEIIDHGDATIDDHRQRIDDVESLDFDPYLIGILRLLVGHDLEHEAFYLPRPGDSIRRKSHKSTTEKTALSSKGSRDSGSKLDPRSPRTLHPSSSISSVSQAPASGLSASSGSISMTTKQRGLEKEKDTFSPLSISDDDLTDLEDDSPKSKRRKSSPPEDMDEEPDVVAPKSISARKELRESRLPKPVRNLRTKGRVEPTTARERTGQDSDGQASTSNRDKKSVTGLKRARTSDKGSVDDHHSAPPRMKKPRIRPVGRIDDE